VKKRKRPRTLAEWREAIGTAVAKDGPYSHNIISLSLMAIASRFGRTEANKAIEDFNLENLGWRKR